MSPSRSPAKSLAAAEVHGVRLTHPDRVLFKEQGITKRELAEYYVAVARWMLPHLVHRPLSLVRCPAGLAGPCFYQKQPPDGLPPAVKRLSIRFKDGPSTGVYVEDLEGLLSLIQFGVLELHAWSARVDDIEHPDRIVFDLDPGAGVAWSAVVETAKLLREFLNELSLTSFVKTTGGKGLHIVAPLEPDRGWPEIKEFTKAVAGAIVAEQPDRYTLTMSKSARPGKIFIDYFRNERGATSVVPYSTRARSQAPVSTPLSWAELSKTRGGDDFTVPDVVARLGKKFRDPWRELTEINQTISDKARHTVEPSPPRRRRAAR